MNQTPAVADIETLRFLGQLIRASKLIETQADLLLADMGLSMTKLQTLSRLLDSEAPLSLTRLAIEQCFVKSNATQLIDNLEANHLVRRIPDPKDRRMTLLQVTDEGKQRHAAALQALLPLADLLDKRFTSEEYVQLRGLLTRLNAG